jgi:glucosylceramidase
MQRITFLSLLTGLGLLFACATCNTKPTSQVPVPASGGTIELWVTSFDKSRLFQKIPSSFAFQPAVADNNPTIEIDTTQTYQTMDGFGFTLTGGSAYVLNQKLSAAQRQAILKELFATDGNNIGISYLRVSIGASDLDAATFSYNDLPSGQTDPEMQKFSLAPDKTNLIPVLKEILAINPAIKIMGSPWSPPTWMKTNDDTKGGSLKPEYYDAYARYFVKYIQGMQAEGISIDAITIQNEPLHPGNNPSLQMQASEQAAFIKQSLGPAFQKAGLKTKIIVYDHNADRPDYPIAILNDPEAKKYIDGSAFHLYAGPVTALGDVHKAHPDKHVYFTEQWTSSEGQFGGDLQWGVKNLVIGASRNWSRTVLQWNLAADPNQEPHTPGGCTQCLGALTIGNSVSRNVSYYTIAHASKFVRPGSVRIASTELPQLPNVVFRTPAGKTVLLVLNESSLSKPVTIKYANQSAAVFVPPAGVSTFVF